MTTGLAQGKTLTDSIVVGLHIATIAAVLSGFASLAPRLRKDTVGT